MKLVPREPTEEMLKAASEHYTSEEYTGYTSTFKAMFDAAPEPKIDMEPVAYRWEQTNSAHLRGYSYVEKCDLKGCESLYGSTQLAALQAENERLQDALKNVNEQAEHFEREWYLRGDEIEQLEAKIKLAFTEDNKMAALLEQEQEIIKLTAERDELLEMLKHIADALYPWCMSDVRELVAKYEGEKHAG